MGFKQELLEFTHAKILLNEPMKKHTGYGVGGKSLYYAEIDSLYTLNEIVLLCKNYKVPYKIIGNGTNLLVSDKGYNGLIINTKKLKDVFFNKSQIKAMSGAPLQKLINFCCENNLGGLEALSGIPATIGGAIVMNAGAFGHTISEKIISVETLLDGKIKKYYNKDCRFGYRESRFLGKKEIIVSATFEFDKVERRIAQESINAYLELRKSMHPIGRTCGSVFKNPAGLSAGKLIDDLFLKGYTVGGAKISEKHCNFIVAKPKATAKDIATLIECVKQKVYNKYKIRLKEEIEYVGEF